MTSVLSTYSTAKTRQEPGTGTKYAKIRKRIRRNYVQANKTLCALRVSVLCILFLFNVTESKRNHVVRLDEGQRECGTLFAVG